MRRIFSASALLAALMIPALAAEPASVVLDVPEMNCSLCPISVKKALERVPGVLKASADLATKSAQATYDPARVTPAALAKAVGDAGFPAAVRPK